MTRKPRSDRDRIPGRRRGFTLIEMTVVCFMMALLTTMMAGAWSAFGRPASDVDSRCRIAQEGSLAAESLARDLSGYQPGGGSTGGLASGKFLDWQQTEHNSLRLCFDSQTSPNGLADWGSPDAVIVYYQIGDQFVRWDQQANTTITVARYLTDFHVIDEGGSVSLQLSFSYRRFQRVYRLIGVKPES